MRFQTVVLGCLFITSLAACSKTDKAENPPTLGEWQIEGQLISASLNGAALNEEEGQMLGLQRLNRAPEPLGCMEPDLSKAETIVSTLPDKFKNGCAMSDFYGDAGQFSATVSCQPDAPLKDASIHIDGMAEANAASVRNAVSIGIDEGNGSTSRIEIVQRIKWTRLDDCQ